MELDANEQIGTSEDSKGDESESRGFYVVLEYFRETNAEALRTRTRVQRMLDLVNSSDRPIAIAAFEETRQLINKKIRDAQLRGMLIEELRRTDPETKAWYARELVQVRNGWGDLNELWPPSNEQDESLSALVKRAQASITILDSVIFTCACQTIPNELDNYLENYRIGTCLDFVATFKDQLPNEESTRAVLAALAPQRIAVSGLIDLRNAQVIKADQRVWRQVVSVAAVVAAAAAGFILILIAVHLGTWFHFKVALKQSQWTALNGAYLLVLVGVLFHWVLDRVKQNRSGTDVTPFSEWLLWIHVNEVSIVVRIVTVWLMVGLAVGFRVFDLTDSGQPFTYFTAGYFMDSTFDALIGRFNTFISSHDPNKEG